MSYFHTDGLDSVRQLTDGTGTLTYAANFDPYGSVLSQNSLGGSSNLGYTGAPSDPSGLIYLNARFYNPSIGSFLTHDPLEGSVGSPRSFNGYSYVGGNPATYIDPSGQCDEQYQSNLGLCALQDVAIVGSSVNTFFGYASVGAQAFGYGVTHHPSAVIAGAFEGFASQIFIPPIAIITSLGSQVFNRLMGKAPASIQEISDYLSRTSRQGLERIVGHQFDELSFLAGNVPGQAAGIAFNVATAAGGFSNLASGLGGAADLLGESLSFQTQASGALAIAGVSTIGLGAALGQAAVGAGELAFGGVNFFAAKGSGGSNNNYAWQPGDPLNAPNSKGNPPSWELIRSRYWQNEAAFRGSEYSDYNVIRMQDGYAPVGTIEAQNLTTGELEIRQVSMELHHIDGRGILPTDPLMSDQNNLLPVWPWQHAFFDATRSQTLPYTFLRWITDATQYR